MAPDRPDVAGERLGPADRPPPWGRFDDLRSGTALSFVADQVVTAERPDQVAPALTEVERATAAGRWAFGYVAYEAAVGLDPAMAVADTTPFEMPLVWFGIGGPPTAVPVITEPVMTVPEVDEDHQGEDGFEASWERQWRPVDHGRRVAAIKERIRFGDTYQINLTERLSATVTGDPTALYRHLALAQRGSYNAYLDLGPWVVASASPELFVQRSGDTVLLRPMKGTARRGRHGREDQLLAERLRTSAKERAENVMIVDLIRNDVSKIAVPGSVAVPSLFAVERYATVLQLTSDVVAELRPGTGLLDLFTALFPCGSVTGAPKLRSMEIIRGLEASPRGVYCGAIGYVAPPAAPVRARFSVAIRTVAIQTGTGHAVYGTGGGITWDSDPEAEQAEAVIKAAVLSARATDFALWETLRYEPESGLRHLDRHLDRLLASADHLGFAANRDVIKAALAARLRAAPAGRVRLALARDGRVSIDVGPLPPPLGRPVALALDPIPVDADDWRLFHKISRREPYDSRQRRHPEADDVIMINTAGELTETTRANLAVRLDGRWWTPPLSSGCLPGVERGRLLDASALRERVLRPADLESAAGLAVVNSLRGWLDAELLGGPSAPSI